MKKIYEKNLPVYMSVARWATLAAKQDVIDEVLEVFGCSCWSKRRCEKGKMFCYKE